MQLENTVPDAAPEAPRPSLPEAAERILGLAADLEAIRREREESTAAADAARQAEEASFRRGRRDLEDEGEREDISALERWRERQAEHESRREARRERLRRAIGGIQNRLSEELREERRKCATELEAAAQQMGAEAAKERQPLEERVHRWEELGPRVRDAAIRTEDALRAFAARHGVDLPATEPWSGEVDVNVNPDRMAESAERILGNVVEETRKAGTWWGSSLARFGSFLMYHLILLAVGIGAAIVAIALGADAREFGILSGAVVLGLVLLHLNRYLVRHRYEGWLLDLAGTTRQTAQRFEAHADAALKHLDDEHISLAEKQAGRLRTEESRIRQASRERTSPLRERLDAFAERERRAMKRLNAKHELRLEALEAEQKEARRKRGEAHEAALARLAEEHAEHLAALEREFAARAEELAARRRDTLDAFERYAASCRETVEAAHRAWGSLDPRRVELPEVFPPFVPFGGLEVSLSALIDPAAVGEEKTFALPATLTFPERGSLLVQHRGGGRERALRLLLNTVLRILVSFPPGKARLTIVDPVGLGQSFSALMHLADQDEALVNGRIWTETAHIQHRLADLTKHIEKVIQKYLRNRYNAIAEYNEVAGELQEPFHFLVIADFPTAFSEGAAEHLASIVNSGPRCGVYTLLAQDTRQEVPPQVDLDRVRANGPVLVAERDGLRLEGEGLDRAAFVPERPPEAGTATTLLDAVGRLSVDADRVEVPFAAVVPEEEELWSGRTTTGVRVPIGRTGAERLQYLDLGRGTAQHALIAGRTGSGKSTLFHVMITNMSLWFSPDEIEFFLIDFKKGVEFKPFATHGLPHARVVAIESDREFGLSVLKAVDGELARRGDLFRRHEVQDLAGYRRCGAPDVLPRVIVLIDEFQEFFTEDDAVARDAALLLDRFVRQGRAFGIHMVLGSQTLSGIYTLAKSTLGQMGVRISLQCDEADSYLILSEDNAVARLLTRPGEAIYNDMSGLIEGNSPFQVVWLPEDEEAVQLERVAARARGDGLPPRETVVFEGNLPADLAANPELLAVVEGGARARDGDDRIWLGDPNAIKGPTEVRFMPASGSNLLVVGQHREAAFAMTAAAVVALSAQHRGEELRLVILDGGGHEPEFAEHFEDLRRAVPHRVERYDLRAVPDAVAELAAHVKAGEGGDGDRPPVYVFAFGLQRLRALRREESYSMSFSAEDEPESAGDQFATVLTEGPPQNVHTVIWCDTVTNLMRVLDRRALREFDVRVLFQMSAADSSELIDSTAANLLGLHSALLAQESQGTFEKFRPYAIPEPAVLRRLGGQA